MASRSSPGRWAMVIFVWWSASVCVSTENIICDERGRKAVCFIFRKIRDSFVLHPVTQMAQQNMPQLMSYCEADFRFGRLSSYKMIGVPFEMKASPEVPDLSRVLSL